MIMKIYIKEDKYSYDIHSLFKAFYPEEEVKVIINESLDESCLPLGIDKRETKGCKCIQE